MGRGCHPRDQSVARKGKYMKREFLQEICGDALTKEMVDAIMAENGRDIHEAKESAKAWQERYEKAQEEFDRKLDDVRFDAQLGQAITAARGRNATAIRALLDVQALKAGKDPKLVEEALDQLKKTDSYLFQQEEAAPIFSIGAGGPMELPAKEGGLAQALRERMERKD